MQSIFEHVTLPVHHPAGTGSDTASLAEARSMQVRVIAPKVID
jgi:hypothetical protein